MSDIPGDNSNDIQITTGIDNNLAQGVAQLTPALNSLAAQLVKLSQSATRNVDLSNTLSRSMGLNVTSAGKFKAELSKLINTQELSGRVMRQSKNDADQLAAAYKRLSAAASEASVRSSAQFGLQQTSSHLSAMTANVKSFDKAIREVRIEHFATRMQQSGARSQQAAYNFTRNFTIPIIAGFRTAFFNFARLETETVRLTKLLGNNFSSVDKSLSGMQSSLQKNREYVAEVGLELDKITAKWGISRVLVQSLAGDFAELGIVSKSALSNLVMFTAEVEKLGNLDIGDSSEFVKTMYQTILRIRRDLKKSVDMSNEAVSEEILGQLRGQIAMFNLIENQTTLSLKNIAQAFPEITAAATSFGLSMTEAAAMLVPMVAAGFQVGASANSVKVSLQRMVAMTKQNTEIVAGLSQELGPGFKVSAGVGMKAIQQLVDGFNLLKNTKGEQGVLELFSRLFGVRQGPRMETSIRQLAAFQDAIVSTSRVGVLTLKQLESTANGIKLDSSSYENIITKQLESSVNAELTAAGLASQKVELKSILSLSELTRLASLRGTAAEIKRADAIQRGQIAAQELLEIESGKRGGPSGRDFLSRTSTEVAKVLLAQAFDTKALAESQLEFELEVAGQTSEVTYRRAKESLMGMGRTIVPIINSILTGLLPSLQKLQLWLSKNSEKFGKFFAVGALALAGIGPLKMLWSTLKILVGTLTGSFLKLYQLFQVTSSSFITFQELLMNPKLLRGSNPVIQYMDGFLIRKNKFDKALRKKSDYSGISIAAREVLEADAGASGAPVTKKIISRIAGSTPITASTASLLISTAEPLSKGARDIADSAVSAQKAISEAIREGLSKGVAHLFVGPNVWEGPNYWVGPNYGAGGGRGGGKGGKDPDTSGMKVTKAKADGDPSTADAESAAKAQATADAKAAKDKATADAKAAKAKTIADTKAAKDKLAADAKAAKDKATADTKAAKAKATADAKAVKDKLAADAKAAKDKATADAKAAKEAIKATNTKATADTKAAKAKATADAKAAKDKLAADAKAAKDKLAADAKAAKDKATADTKAAKEAIKATNTKTTADDKSVTDKTAKTATTESTADTKAAKAKATADAKAVKDKLAADAKAAKDKATADAKAAKDKLAADAKATKDKLAADAKAAKEALKSTSTKTAAQTSASQPVILPDSKPKRGRPRNIPTGGSVTAPVSNAAANAALIVADSKAGIVESVAETSSQVKRGGTRGRKYKKVMVSWADIIKMHDDAGVQIDEELRWLSQSTRTFEITEAKRNSIKRNIEKTKKPFIKLTKKAPLREGFDRSFQAIDAIPGDKGRVRATGAGASLAGLAFAKSKEEQIQPFMDSLVEELRVVGDKTKLTSFFDTQAKFRRTGRNSASQILSLDVDAIDKRTRPIENLFNFLTTTEEDLVGAIENINLHQGNTSGAGKLVKREFREVVSTRKPKPFFKGLLGLALQRANIDTRELTDPGLLSSMSLDESLSVRNSKIDESLAERDSKIIKKWVKSITRKTKNGLVLKKSLFSKEEIAYLLGIPTGEDIDFEESYLLKDLSEFEQRSGKKLPSGKSEPPMFTLQDYQRANQLPVTDPVSDVINTPRGQDVAAPRVGRQTAKQSAANARIAAGNIVAGEKEDLRIAASAKETLANLSPDIPAETPTVVKPKRVRAPRISKSAKKAVEDISRKLPKTLSAAFNPQTFGDLINQQIQAVEDALTDVKGRFKLPAAKAGNISSRMRAKIVELTKNSKYAVNLPNLLATPISEISNDILKSIDGIGKGLVDDLSEGIKNKKTFLTPEGAGERQVATKGWKARIDSALDKIKKSKVTPTRAITDGLLSSVFRDALKAAEEGLDAVSAEVAAATRTAAASVPGANKPTTPRVRTPRGKASIPLDPATMLPLNPDDQLQPMASDETSKKKKTKIVRKAAESKVASDAAAAAQIAAEEATAAQLVADKASAEAAIKEEKRLATNAKRRAARAAKKAALSTQVSAAQIATEVAASRTVIPPLTIPNRIPVLNTLKLSQIAEVMADMKYFADDINQQSISQAIDPLGPSAGKKTIKQSLSSATNAFSTKIKSLTQSLSGVPEKISSKGKGVAAALSSVGSSISSKGKSLVSAIASTSAALTKGKVSSIGRSLLRTGEKIAMSPFSTGDINSPMGLSKRGYLDLINKDMTGVRGAKGLRTVLGSGGGGVFGGMSESGFDSFGEGRVKLRALGKGLTPTFNQQGVIEGFIKAKKGAESVNISLAEGEKILRRRFLPAVNGLDNIFKSKSASRYFKLSTVGFGPGAISGFKAISKYVKDIPNSHVKATSAVEALKTKYTQLGKTAPGAIRRSAAYANSMLPVGDLLKGGVSKIASIFTTIISLVVKFAFTFLLIAPIVILVVGLLGKMKEAVGRNGPAFQNLKDALKNVKDAFYALAKPLITLFLGFAGVENKMLGLGTEGEKIAAVFYIFSKAIKSATEKFKAFAEGKSAQQMMQGLGEITVRLINRFILLGGAIKSLFSGDKEAAGKKLKAFLVSILYEIVAIVQIMTLALSKAFQGLGIVIEPVIKGLMLAFKAFFSWLISATIDASKSMGKSIAYGLGDMLLDGITLNNGSKVKDAYSGIINPIATTIGPRLGIPNTITDSSAPAVSATDKGLLDSVTGISKTIADGISAGMGKGSEFLGGINEQIAAKFKELTGFDINTPMVNTIKGGVPEIQAAIKYVTAKSGDVATAGGESLGSKIAQGIKQKMQDVKKQFADLLYSNLDSKVDKIIDKYKSALDKQKDIYLKAYDDQIAGLDALEEAESSLTDKMEYEINRREKIKNREQDSENYRRERKLAVYEGRIEDVRRLDQEEVRASDDHSKELSDLDLGENKRLSAEQREIVKAAIEQEKRLQDKRFDSLIENYSELIEKIKEKGFTTQEEFQAMMTEITWQTDKTGTEMAESFTESMLALPAAIAAVRDESIPLFASIGTAAVGSIDDLINKAKTKFGLEADVNNPSSMLGAAWKLANGSSDAFAAAFDSTLYAKYVNEAFAEVEKVTKRLFTPGDPLNVAEAWENAGKSAFAKIQQELNRELMFDVIMKSFAGFIAKLKPIVDKVVAQAEKMKSALESVGKVSATPAPVLSEAWQKSTMAQMGQYATPTTGLTKEKAAAIAAQSELDRAKATAWIGTNYPLDVSGMLDALPSSGLTKSAQFLAQNWIKQYLGSGVNQTIGLAPLPMTFAGATRYFGGYMKKYGMGGMTAYNLGSYIDKPSNIGVPALLHGGEYIINHKAVNKFGKSNLAAINNLRHGGDLPGFALGGYVGNLMSNRMSGYAKGGSILRPRDNPSEQGVSGFKNNKDISGLKVFNSSSGPKYLVPDTKIRSGEKYGMILHPLDWQTIARSENGPNWKNSLGKISKTREGVFVGALNISRSNWKTYGGLEFGNFNSGPTPSFEDQIKVAERIYTGYFSPKNKYPWPQEPRYIDGMQGVREGKAFFKPLSELKAYDKARGFEKGGYVGTADAIERRALGKSNAPKSLFGRMKDNPMGYAKGFAKETLRPKNLLPMIGAVVGGILGSFGGPVGTVAGSVGGATIGGGIGEAIEQTYGKFVSKTRESFNVGNIVKHGLFSGIADLATLGVGKYVAKPLGNFIKPIFKGQLPSLLKLSQNIGIGKNYIKELFTEPKIKGTIGVMAKDHTGIIDMLLRKDNMSIRTAKDSLYESTGKDFLEKFAQMKKDGASSEALQQLTEMRRSEVTKIRYPPGPITKAIDMLYNLNPLNLLPSRRIGVHVGGSSGLEIGNFIAGGMKTRGPGDSLPNSMYSWLKGTPEKIAYRASGFAEGEFGAGGGVGKPWNDGALKDLMEDTPDVFYNIVQHVGKIFRDANIPATASRRSNSAKILEILPITSSQEEIAKAVARQRVARSTNLSYFSDKFGGKIKTILGTSALGSIAGGIFGQDKDKSNLARLFDVVQNDSKTSPLYWITQGVKKIFDIDQYKSQAGAPPRTLQDVFTGNVRYSEYVKPNDPRYYNNPEVISLAESYYKDIGIKTPLSKEQIIEYAKSMSPDFQPQTSTGAPRKNPLPWTYRTGDKNYGYDVRWRRYGDKNYEVFSQFNDAIDHSSYRQFVSEDRKPGESDLSAALRKSNNKITFVQDITNGIIGSLNYDQYRRSMEEIATLAGANYKIITVKDATKFNEDEYISKNGLSYIVKLTKNNYLKAGLDTAGRYYGNTLPENEKYGSYISSEPIFVRPNAFFSPLSLIPEPIKEPINFVAKKLSSIFAGQGSFTGPLGTDKYQKSFNPYISPVLSLMPALLNLVGGDSGHVTKHELMHAIFGASDVTTNKQNIYPNNDTIMSYLNYSGEFTKQDLDFMKYQLQGQILPKDFDGLNMPLYLQRALDPIKSGKYNGGYIPKFKKGGYVGYANGGAVPAVLHGGEYVLNAKSVAKIGVPQLQAMNAMKFETPNVKYNTPSPQIANYPTGQVSSSTSNVNIYVDNFIGEPEWFKGMMSQYNTKILPGKQKSAGLENRVISTYTGLNGGR